MSDNLTLPTPSELRSARTDRGLTMKKLAELAGVHELTICNHENGKRMMSPGTLGKVVTALNKIPKIKIE